jgi:small subunit ribosomal protein S1
LSTMSVQQQDVDSGWWQTLLDGNYLGKRPRCGDVYEVTTLAINNNDIFVDLGGKRDGVIQREDLAEVDRAYLDNLKIGDRVPVRVMKVPSDQSAILVSLKQGLEQHEWTQVQTWHDNQEIVAVKVLEVNHGGLIITLGELRGFIPNSHLVTVPRGMRGKKRHTEKLNLVGQTLQAIIIELDLNERRLVLSERLAQRQQRAALLAELHEGAICKGIIRNLTDYGVFIDLGGVDGLLHISELSWDYVKHPRDLYSVGDEIEVYVLEVDREKERVSLSRKRLLPAKLAD